MLASALALDFPKPPAFELDDATIKPAVVQLHASDKGVGKTFRERIKGALRPEILDVAEIEERENSRRQGKASPIVSRGSTPGLGTKSPGTEGSGTKEQGTTPGAKNSGKNSGNVGGRSPLVFAETPLWCDGPLPFQDALVNALLSETRKDQHKLQSETPPTSDRSASGCSSSETWGSEQPESTSTMPQVQYVPVPTPVPVPSCVWNGLEHSQMTPMMITVPVPVPVANGNADASAARNASFSAADPDFYSAFRSSYQPQQPPEPPAGFVPPPGYKLVPAPGPMRDMATHPGSWPSIGPNNILSFFSSLFGPNNMTVTMNHDVRHAREEPRSTSDMAKRPASSEVVAGNGKLFIGGLKPSTTVDTIKEHFSAFGKLVAASVIRDPITKLSRGFGFVEFECSLPPELLELNHVIDGRKVGVKRYTYAAS